MPHFINFVLFSKTENATKRLNPYYSHLIHAPIATLNIVLKHDKLLLSFKFKYKKMKKNKCVYKIQSERENV